MKLNDHSIFKHWLDNVLAISSATALNQLKWNSITTVPLNLLVIRSDMAVEVKLNNHCTLKLFSDTQWYGSWSETQ